MAKAKKTTRKTSSAGHSLSKRHVGHSRHLCEMANKRQMGQVGKLSKGAKYLCYVCGRSAARSGNLCEPVSL
ncbi:MAG: hypothetical protein ACYSTL_01790 [Planctomycetota bacterium]|jgi:hypothetical protein